MTRVGFRLVLQVLLGFALGSSVAGAQQTPPVLDDMQAMQAAMEASAFGPEDASIGAVEFDEDSRKWLVPVDRGEGKSPRTLVITVDEASGAVCAHEPASNQCRAQGDASPLIKAQRDKRIALEEAAKHPPPDLQGAMIALIRYQLTTENAYLQGMRLPMYVSMQPLDDGKPVDLSPEAVQSLSDTGMEFFPGSTWVPPEEDARMGTSIRMWIGLPTRRDDGDYDVQYAFWCGRLCASDHVAVLHHDATGWHLVSSVMNSIS